MEKKYRRIVFGVCGLVVTVCVCIALIMSKKNYTVYAKIDKPETEETTKEIVLAASEIKQDTQEENAKNTLVLTLPINVQEEWIRIKNNAVKHEVEMILPEIKKEYLQENPIEKTGNAITRVSYWYEKGEIHVKATMDSVYEYEIQQKGKTLVVEFFRPKEKYNQIVTIDAGHGGNHPGTVVGNVLEKDITLGIVKKLKLLLDSASIKAYYTRLDDTNPSLEERVALANDSESDLFLSVHVNADETSQASSGVEALYRINDTGRTFTSKDFAEICMEETSKQTGSRKRKLVSDESICIVRTAKAPVALVEVGFITNAWERSLMVTEEYQDKIANALFESILQSLELCKNGEQNE